MVGLRLRVRSARQGRGWTWCLQAPTARQPARSCRTAGARRWAARAGQAKDTAPGRWQAWGCCAGRGSVCRLGAPALSSVQAAANISMHLGHKGNHISFQANKTQRKGRALGAGFFKILPCQTAGMFGWGAKAAKRGGRLPHESGRRKGLPPAGGRTRRAHERKQRANAFNREAAAQ